MIFKDEKIARLEKRISELERKTEKNFEMTGESFNSLREIMLRMQKENAELKRDRDFLLERYKEVLRTMGSNRVIEPIKKEIEENANLIRDIVIEDLDIEPKSKNIDDLFEIVMKKKKISMKSAAKTLSVPESQAAYWAEKLKKQNLIEISGNDLLKK